MEDIMKNITNTTYFKYCGEINTEPLLHKALTRCKELEISQVIIASETGKSALKALTIFPDNIKLIVVTHPPAKTWGPKGDIPIGIFRKEYESTRKTLEDHNIVIIQGTRPLVPPSRTINWEYPTPECIIDKTLEIFSAGTKIAIESVLITTDAGKIKEGEEVISCAGTFKGLDTALVVKASYTMNFFTEFEVREIIAKPRYRVKELPEYDFKNWKGDLDKYYG